MPSKSTVYVSNIPFSFTNNDLHKIFEMYGKVVKVTVVKDKTTRQSKGVAFVLFLNRESAYAAVRAINNKQMFGRQLKCSIAVDNGRTAEFIRRKNYLDKSRCYECGDFGHLSYRCPKNSLGEREPPPKKPKKRKRKDDADEPEEEEEEESDEGEDPALDTLSAAISFQQQLIEEEEYRHKVASGNYDDTAAAVKPSDDEGEAATSTSSGLAHVKRKRIRPNNYFSDEEELEDETNN